MENKTVLVFGGSGFLGRFLVKELYRRDYTVVVADLTENHDLNAYSKFIKCDIEDSKEIENAFEQSKPQFVYNLAGFANLDRAIEQPIKTMQLNVMSNLTIIESCLNYKTEKFVYASSAYAMSSKGSFYGISKLASEKLIEEYHEKRGLEFVILRYGSVYSEEEFDNNYLFNLVKEAVVNGEINHKGDGEEIREYIHAVDAAKLSVDVLETKEFDNIHAILTGTERMKRVELFHMINEILGGKVSIKMSNSGYTNHYKYTPYSFVPSVSKKFVANPHIDMGQGILECIRNVHKLI